LSVGSAFGSIRQLFLKIKAIDAKHGKFDFVLCTGDFFGPIRENDAPESEDDQVRELLEGRLEGIYALVHGRLLTKRSQLHLNVISCKGNTLYRT
jgi:hypothetical protein